MATYSIENLTPAVQAAGRLLKPYVGSEKPGKTELLLLAARSFTLVLDAAQGAKHDGEELWDLDTEEAQQLSFLFAKELEGVTEQTKVDDIAAKFLYAIPAIRAAVVGVKTGHSWELKGALIGDALKAFGALADQIWSPKPAIVPETEVEA